jgi:hypothetical protein
LYYADLQNENLSPRQLLPNDKFAPASRSQHFYQLHHLHFKPILFMASSFNIILKFVSAGNSAENNLRQVFLFPGFVKNFHPPNS